MPASPHRNTLAIVQNSPGLFGEAGRLLGVAGEQEVTRTLDRLAPHSIVGKRIKVTRGDGSPAGDLDVVVCDPSSRALAVFEIKWHISADGNAEVYRLERAAIDKRKQVVRLRREIVEGSATVAWPHGWPDTGDFSWNWFVLTRDVLSTRDIDSDGVVLRSHQLLARTLRAGATVDDLVRLLRSPPMPPAAICETQWERIRYGDLTVEFEALVA